MSGQDTSKRVRQINSAQFASLVKFFDDHPEFKTPNGCPYTTISDQLHGINYYLPTEFENRGGDIDLQPTINAVSVFFHYYEIYRKATVGSGAIASFAERQTRHIPPYVPGADTDAASVPDDAQYDAGDISQQSATEWDDVAGDDDAAAVTAAAAAAPAKPGRRKVVQPSGPDLPLGGHAAEPGKRVLGTGAAVAPRAYYKDPVPREELDRAHFKDDSCLMLDFDIYQKSLTRQIRNDHFTSLVQVLADLLPQIFDMGQSPVTIYAAILHKSAVRKVTHAKYKECSKDSFHCRLYVRMTKAARKYIITKLREGVLDTIFGKLDIHGTPSEMLDENSASVPAMLLGSAKRDALLASEFQSLYQIQYTGSMKTVLQCHFFDTRVEIKGGKVKTQTYIHPNHNLAYELSLVHEDPHGIIRKVAFPIHEHMQIHITTHVERRAGDAIPLVELEQTKQNVLNLTVRDNRASYIAKILDIISLDRIKSYGSWRDIICMIASESPDYKPLAYHFSQRTPAEYTRGESSLEQIWDWARAHPSTTRTMATLFSWARSDNPDRYRDIQKNNVFMVLQDLIIKQSGNLNEKAISDILYTMFRDIFVCDVNEKSLSDRRIWYEFVMPGEDSQQNNQMLYKWRCEQSKPDGLARYIINHLPKLFAEAQTYITTRKSDEEQLVAEGGDADASIKFYDKVNKNLTKLIHSLGTPGKVQSIISMCEYKFRTYGFVKRLNTDPNSIGVHNCVIVLRPRLEILQGYHTIPITRTCNAQYVPYVSKRTRAPRNPEMVKLKEAIKMCFAKPDGSFDRESYRYIMIYLATSLDANRKIPMFFMWYGGGGNGKTFILDMHTMTLGMVSDNGYGCKLNSSFFTNSNRSAGGPDSEKMSMEYARSIYTSELPHGSVLLMDKIKEFTSEVITGNDKNEKQKMFFVNSNFICGVNFLPNIVEQDHGTWRRILVYNFRREFKTKQYFDPKNPLHTRDNREFGEQAVHKIEYRSAYLGLLVHYYKKWYLGKYYGDINNVPCETIRRTTREYRDSQNVISRFITLYVKHRDYIETSPDEQVRCKLVDIVDKYIKWYTGTINNGARPNRDQVFKDFRETELRRDLVLEHGVEYINNWYVFGVGEEQKLKTVLSGPGAEINHADGMDDVEGDDADPDAADADPDAADDADPDDDFDDPDVDPDAADTGNDTDEYPDDDE